MTRLRPNRERKRERTTISNPKQSIKREEDDFLSFLFTNRPHPARAVPFCLMACLYSSPKRPFSIPRQWLKERLGWGQVRVEYDFPYLSPRWLLVVFRGVGLVVLTAVFVTAVLAVAIFCFLILFHNILLFRRLFTHTFKREMQLHVSLFGLAKRANLPRLRAYMHITAFAANP